MALPIPQELTEYISFYDTTVPYQSKGTRTQDTLIANAWARITEAGGTYEPTTQQNEEQVQSFEVITQYISTLRAWHSITWGSRTLTIKEPPQKIFDRNNRQWMIIHAEEVVERSL